MGLDNVQTDPRFIFLSFFNAEEEEDSVPDSFFFFINNQCSPYSDFNINCSYLDVGKIKDLDPKKFTVFSLHIQSLPAKFSEFSDLISEFRAAIPTQTSFASKKHGKF